MRKWAKGTAGAALLTASFVALGAGMASADVTNGDGSVLGGNQINAPISVPIDVSGNAVAVLGHARAGSKGGASVHHLSGVAGHHGRTSGRHSILGGNQINAPITAPINACGNSVAALGRALSGCEGGSSVVGDPLGGHHGRTSGRHSIGGGNQINAPINAPIDVCGNSAAALGDALSGCHGGAGVVGAPGDPSGARIARTSGRHSILGGNQVYAPVNAPIDVCGNAIGGDALAGCRGGSFVGAPGQPGGGFVGRTSGRHSILGGNQVDAPITAPVDVCGNAAAVLGRALGSCGADHGTPGMPGAPGSYSAADCPQPSSARMSDLPVEPQAMSDGGLPVTPALPKLPVGAKAAQLLGHDVLPQSGQAHGPLGGALKVPAVGGPVKQLPPLKLSAAESPAGSPNGALAALVLAGMVTLSAGTVALTRRLTRR